MISEVYTNHTLMNCNTLQMLQFEVNAYNLASVECLKYDHLVDLVLMYLFNFRTVKSN